MLKVQLSISSSTRWNRRWKVTRWKATSWYNMSSLKLNRKRGRSGNLMEWHCIKQKCRRWCECYLTALGTSNCPRGRKTHLQVDRIWLRTSCRWTGSPSTVAEHRPTLLQPNKFKWCSQGGKYIYIYKKELLKQSVSWFIHYCICLCDFDYKECSKGAKHRTIIRK